MSVIQLLLMPAERRPKMAQIAELGATADPPFKPHEADTATHTGFLPLSIEGRKSGFEYHFSEVEVGALPEPAISYGSHQMVARTGGRLDELLASLLFFRAAAALSGAAYVYVDEAIIVPPEKVDSYLTEQIAGVRRLLK